MWTGSNPSLPSNNKAAEDDRKRRAAIRANKMHAEQERINSNETLNSKENHF